MSTKTSIEWTRSDDGTPGATWNPVTGCTKVSPGCEHCYAETFAERFRGTSGHYFENGFDVQLREDKVGQPLRWRTPRRVFVNSMSDLFHDAIPAEHIASVFAVMAAAHWHTFQLLTKRHGRMRSLLNDPDFLELVKAESATLAQEGVDIQTGNPWEHWPLRNLWMGVSVENQQWADIRIPALLGTPAAVRFISAEPLLGPVDLTRSWMHCPVHDSADGMDFCTCPCEHRTGIDWVITGAESGRGARPAHPDWFRMIRDHCTANKVAYFHKQNGEWAPIGPLYGDSDEADDAHMEAVDLEVRSRKSVIQLERSGHVADGYQPTDPRTWLMARVGKKAAGRVLDGREWSEFPTPTTGDDR